MKLYHASRSKIEDFNFQDGCHFGSKFSAYEAALRKVESSCDTIYLHQVVFDPSSLRIFDWFDEGNSYNWSKTIHYVDSLGYNCIQYKNLFEPSAYPSYLMFGTDIKVLGITCQEMTGYQVEDCLSYIC